MEANQVLYSLLYLSWTLLGYVPSAHQEDAEMREVITAAAGL